MAKVLVMDKTGYGPRSVPYSSFSEIHGDSATGHLYRYQESNSELRVVG
jgi:hypothetical protein